MTIRGRRGGRRVPRVFFSTMRQVSRNQKGSTGDNPEIAAAITKIMSDRDLVLAAAKMVCLKEASEASVPQLHYAPNLAAAYRSFWLPLSRAAYLSRVA
jgi:hypothetical protein